ncbi:hypothetical protein NX801_17635 [Streptomyces sp. LP05-1]|uniref:Uncharacterized protein n=1 Tax=Streptomyces pyxinae TaxID=2970734 RepID=A0ABT2CJ73_9ACTN|nr:hypothetical protein [Streptomyces sp. LP05-1]MCS0637452.1 hypothetical protein [Streptomyces sp. LP05-1]
MTPPTTTPADGTGRLTGEDLRQLLGLTLHDETVEHTARRTGVPREYAERQVLECLRYLYLVSRHRDRLSGLFLPVEQDIDEIWHYLILQTREYRALCEERLPGRYFVHHRSVSYEEYQREPGREQAIEQALRWIPLYCAAFGPFDEGALPHWTIVRFLHQRMNMPLAEISALAPLPG